MNTPSRQSRKEADNLLRWYDNNARVLPWRIAPKDVANGIYPDAYSVWLSEIMLQQTQVKTVVAYYHKFLTKWPKVTALAASSEEEILKAWAGLGYYSRARNLKKCADIVAAKYGGIFPDNSADLIKLPGIGAYTSAAIAAIAFNEPIAVIDGNVERVTTRLFTIATPLPKAKPEIASIVQAMVPKDRPGDFAQAMMDLGATICTPKKPLCHRCPLHQFCEAHKLGNQQAFPVNLPKKKIPKRFGATFIAISNDNKILIRTRNEKGMLAGMSEFPSSNWSVQHDGDTKISAAPFISEWETAGKIQHQFTHFKLEMNVYWCRTHSHVDVEGRWVMQEEIPDEALPVLFRKALALAQRSIHGSREGA